MLPCCRCMAKQSKIREKQWSVPQRAEDGGFIAGHEAAGWTIQHSCRTLLKR